MEIKVERILMNLEMRVLILDNQVIENYPHLEDKVERMLDKYREDGK